MYRVIGGKIVKTSDSTRVKFRTNISQTTLDELNLLAQQSGTHINYLIESGLIEVLKQNHLPHNDRTPPKDRVQFKTTYDRKLLEEIRKFAKDHHLFINEVIESSVQFINTEIIKNNF